MMDSLLLDRLENKFLVGDNCWEWTAAKSTSGYGRFKWEGRMRQAHRVIYEMMIGPIPDGLELDHLCRTPGCVRPDHLEPVTHAENLRRSPKLGRDGTLARARKVSCVNGHKWDEANTHWYRGSKRCRACDRARYTPVAQRSGS